MEVGSDEVHHLGVDGGDGGGSRRRRDAGGCDTSPSRLRYVGLSGAAHNGGNDAEGCGLSRDYREGNECSTSSSSSSRSLGVTPSMTSGELSESVMGQTRLSRDRWGSRVAFLLAAIGSAIGIGNLWRFPFLAYRFGGGAFFIPYLISLFVVGIPILQLEFSLGQFYQGGHAVAFNSLSKRSRGLGLAAPFSCFIVVVYYGAILSWSLIYFAASFINPLPWETKNLAMTETCATLVTKESCTAVEVCQWKEATCRPAAEVYADKFFVDVLNLDDPSSFTLRGCGYAVAGLAITWICIFLAIFKGARMLGKVLYVTMILPIILLLVMTIRSVALEGANDGLRQYILQWDFSILVDEPEIWSSAVGQIFFSLGVCYGIMTAYASFNRKHQNVVQDAVIVAASNSAFSIVAGVVVFAIAGHLAYISNGTLEDLKTGGVGLVFMTFPTALAEMKGVSAQIFSALFFLMFFLLGIDSAFSMVEASVTILSDSRTLSKIKKVHIIWPLCIIGFLCALPFVSNIGPDLIDVVDFAVANFASIFIGFSECTVAGWVQGASQQAAFVGWPSVIFFFMSYFGSLILATAISFGVQTELAWADGLSAGTILGPIFGFVFFVVGTTFAIFLISTPKPTKNRTTTTTTTNQLEDDQNNNTHPHRDSSTSPPPDLSSLDTVDPHPPANNPTLHDSQQRRQAFAAALGTDDVCSVFHSTNKSTTTSVGHLSKRDKLWWLFLGNVEMLRRELNSVVGSDTRCCGCVCPSTLSTLRLPWSILIKFAIPAFLLVLLVKTFFSEELPYFRSFPPAYQALALTLAFIAIAIVILGVIFPSVYSQLIPDDDDQHHDHHHHSDWSSSSSVAGSVGSKSLSPSPLKACRHHHHVDHLISVNTHNEASRSTIAAEAGSGSNDSPVDP